MAESDDTLLHMGIDAVACKPGDLVGEVGVFVAFEVGEDFFVGYLVKHTGDDFWVKFFLAHRFDDLVDTH